MKVVALISGGIDSVVAAALALEDGADVVAVHFSLVPLSDARGEEKTQSLLKLLAKKYRRKIRLYVLPHGPSLIAIAQNCDRKYNCILCRRMMLRIAERIAEKEGADALLTGESLGQVASQTLSNLNAEAGCVEIPIARPLIGMDKIEIEKLGKKFGTFEMSILPSSCCRIPDKPATRSTREIIEKEESKLNLKELAENSLRGAEVLEIGPG